VEEEQPELHVQIVPISIRYSSPIPHWRSKAAIAIGKPLSTENYCQKPRKDCIRQLRDDLQQALKKLHQHNVSPGGSEVHS